MYAHMYTLCILHMMKKWWIELPWCILCTAQNLSFGNFKKWHMTPDTCVSGVMCQFRKLHEKKFRSDKKCINLFFRWFYTILFLLFRFSRGLHKKCTLWRGCKCLKHAVIPKDVPSGGGGCTKARSFAQVLLKNVTHAQTANEQKFVCDDSWRTPS